MDDAWLVILGHMPVKIPCDDKGARHLWHCLLILGFRIIHSVIHTVHHSLTLT
uniref:Uncharacterized protein n=1 Tax=Aegilops tauschii subsp. strangulata TaxID=200361 RepID=A0A453F436_AEGTS